MPLEVTDLWERPFMNDAGAVLVEGVMAAMQSGEGDFAGQSAIAPIERNAQWMEHLEYLLDGCIRAWQKNSVSETLDKADRAFCARLTAWAAVTERPSGDLHGVLRDVFLETVRSLDQRFFASALLKSARMHVGRVSAYSSCAGIDRYYQRIMALFCDRGCGEAFAQRAWLRSGAIEQAEEHLKPCFERIGVVSSLVGARITEQSN